MDERQRSMALNSTEGGSVNAQIADIERRTGVRITTTIVARCDAYVELPWKAFALGASLAAFAVVLVDIAVAAWPSPWSALWHAIAILGAGATSALAAVGIPAWARLFLRPSRRDVEVRQHAQALFLTRELFATPQRTGVLILVSRFERKIEILADAGLHNRIGAAEWRSVIARMTPALRAGHPFHALRDGLAAVDELVSRKGIVAVPP